MRVTTVALLWTTVLFAACGGTNSITSSTPPTPTPPPTEPPPPNPAQPATISITATGFTPLEVSVAVGSRVTFVNTDSRPHDMLGGPDHTRPDCPEVDVVGFLVPGQSRETGVFTGARTCEFHDHTNIGNPAFQGRIVVR